MSTKSELNLVHRLIGRLVLTPHRLTPDEPDSFPAVLLHELRRARYRMCREVNRENKRRRP